MLVDTKSRREITHIPRRETFDLIRRRLGADEFQGVVDAINEKIDRAGDRIATAGFLPGKDWSGTRFQCLHEKAAKGNRDLSAKMFGLMVWHAVSERQEEWASGRYEIDGRDIGSLTYFRVWL